LSTRIIKSTSSPRISALQRGWTGSSSTGCPRIWLWEKTLSACSGCGLTQNLRHGLPCQVEDIGRDGAKLGGFEHQTPAGHACTLDALGDDAKHLLGLAAVLPLAVADIADGRTQQAARDRAVATSFLAMTGRAAGEVNRPPLEQELIACDFWRRRRGRRAEHVVRQEARGCEPKHSQENPTRGRGINSGRRFLVGIQVVNGQGWMSLFAFKEDEANQRQDRTYSPAIRTDKPTDAVESSILNVIPNPARSGRRSFKESQR